MEIPKPSRNERATAAVTPDELADMELVKARDRVTKSDQLRQALPFIRQRAAELRAEGVSHDRAA